MTYADMVLDDRQLLDVFDCARGCGALVMVHCEGYDAIKFMTERLERASKTAPYYHVSGRQAMEQIRWAQQRGLKVYGETCPQYIALTAEDMKGLNMDETGGKYVCSPPPRDEASWDAIWEGLRGGVFQTFSSDHCPFRYDDTAGKLSPKGRTSFRWVPNGIPGVETRLPILFSKGVGEGRLTLNEFVALTSTNHAKIYGLYPAGHPASWLRLHALRGNGGDGVAGDDHPARRARHGGGAHPWCTLGRPVPAPVAVAVCGAAGRRGGGIVMACGWSDTDRSPSP